MSPRFNLDDYETVASRIERFYSEHAGGRIVTWVEWHDPDMSKLIFGAKVYRSEDESPWATGFAFEILGSTPVNKTSHVENAETSAIGRALANAGYATKERASREEMEKVERGVERVPDPGIPVAPLSTDEQNERIMALGRQLKEIVGETAAKDAYREERAAAGGHHTRALLGDEAARIIPGLELRLSLAQEDSAASASPTDAAERAAVEPVAQGSGGSSVPTAAPPKSSARITIKQRGVLEKLREELVGLVGGVRADESWFELLEIHEAHDLDGLSKDAAVEMEKALRLDVKSAANFEIPESIQQKLTEKAS